MTRKQALDEALRAAAERQAREVRDTAATLIEERGHANARAWCEHCMARDPVGGFWRAVQFEVDRQAAAEIFAKARAARAAREATRDPITKRLP